VLPGGHKVPYIMHGEKNQRRRRRYTQERSVASLLEHTAIFRPRLILSTTTMTTTKSHRTIPYKAMPMYHSAPYQTLHSLPRTATIVPHLKPRPVLEERRTQLGSSLCEKPDTISIWLLCCVNRESKKHMACRHLRRLSLAVVDGIRSKRSRTARLGCRSFAPTAHRRTVGHRMARPITRQFWERKHAWL